MVADPGPPSVDPVPTVPDLVLPGAEVWLLALGAASPTMAAVSAALREPKGLKQQGAIYSGGYRGGLVPGAAMLGDDGGRGRNPTPCPGSVDAVVAGGPRPFYRGGGEGVQTCFSNGSSALRHVVAGHLTTGAAAGGPVYARRNPSPVFYRCRQRRHHEVPISLLEGVVRGVPAAVHLLVGHGYWSREILARRCAGAVIDDAFGRRCTPWRR